MDLERKHFVAVIGAGPAGLFAARELALNGVFVVIVNRDIKPGGLAEYGIYPEKIRMKEGLRAQFRQILAMDHIEYCGNILVGTEGDVRLDDFKQTGFQAILVTAGAQGTKWLGLPGEDLLGVYHAKDLVYHYNLLPPYSQRNFHIGRRAAVIGAGNVMLDITRYLLTAAHVDEVTTVVRRGPAEVKFDKKELETVVAALDGGAFETEMERVTPLMRSLGQDPDETRALIASALEKAEPVKSEARFTIQFLLSPVRVIGDGGGLVTGLEVEENTLVVQNGEVKARSLGTRRVLDVDTVVFAIGDRVDDRVGLPVVGNEFVKNPNPRFPVDGISFEVFNPQTNQPVEGVFVAGWARRASTGLVGVARKDGTNGARAVLQYLQTLPPLPDLPLETVCRRIEALQKPVVKKTDLARLDSIEHDRSQQLGVPDYKFASNMEMIEAMGLD